MATTYNIALRHRGTGQYISGNARNATYSSEV
jgi:hypothetical protein